MRFTTKFNLVALALTVCFFSSSAKAAFVSFTFTGTGLNGSTASGNFTVDEGSLYPGYFATGGIFPSLSLTISSIPGGGPSSVSFDVNDLPFTRFTVDINNVAYIAPYGSHGFGAPDQNHYDLGQPSQPFLPSFVYVTGLGYNGFARDIITWSVATQSSVPEPGSALVVVTAVILGAIVLRLLSVHRLCGMLEWRPVSQRWILDVSRD